MSTVFLSAGAEELLEDIDTFLRRRAWCRLRDANQRARPLP